MPILKGRPRKAGYTLSKSRPVRHTRILPALYTISGAKSRGWRRQKKKAGARHGEHLLLLFDKSFIADVVHPMAYLHHRRTVGGDQTDAVTMMGDDVMEQPLLGVRVQSGGGLIQ